MKLCVFLYAVLTNWYLLAFKKNLKIVLAAQLSQKLFKALLQPRQANHMDKSHTLEIIIYLALKI